jgi:hypothetical protein
MQDILFRFSIIAFFISISFASASDETSLDYSIEVPIQSDEKATTRREELEKAKMDELAGDYVDKVVLGALDKVTARVSRLTAKIDEPVQFGTLTIVVKKCWQADPEEKPEKIAFLEIAESKPGKPKAIIFRGWMFASTPSVVTLVHPVFDVWVTQDIPDAPTGVQVINDEATKKLDQLLDKLRELPEE